MAQQGPNPIELYEAAVQAFRQTLSGVKADQMQGSTPCSEWNVQALITHNIQVAAFVEGLLQENITVNPLDVSVGIAGDDPCKYNPPHKYLACAKSRSADCGCLPHGFRMGRSCPGKFTKRPPPAAYKEMNHGSATERD